MTRGPGFSPSASPPPTQTLAVPDGEGPRGGRGREEVASVGIASPDITAQPVGADGSGDQQPDPGPEGRASGHERTRWGCVPPGALPWVWTVGAGVRPAGACVARLGG